MIDMLAALSEGAPDLGLGLGDEQDEQGRG